MFYEFKTQTFGKWILAGEHAVLRGHGALVFPLKEKKLTLKFNPDPHQLSIYFSGQQNEEMADLILKVLTQGKHLLDLPELNITGCFDLQSNIPLGSGMGASAALCVAIGRWYAAQKLLPDNEVFTFARQLENLFHGQSSGLDIAGTASSEGVYFCQGEITPLQINWQPNWYLSFCGQTASTSPCIQQVQNIWQNNPALAADIDDRMQQSVLSARQALRELKESSLKALSVAIEQSAECFRAWGLINQPLQNHMKELIKKGALAVKPTGSGNGGYILSLWPEDKKSELSWIKLEI